MAIAVALAAAGCAMAPVRHAQRPRGHATTTTSTTAPTTTTTVAEPPVAPVAWTPCGGLQCGTVTVPLDYAHPQSGTIAIALERHPAGEPGARIGSLVINPGGPGDSGINDLPNELDVLTPQLLARFDIVSFDPRGVQRSDPVSCGPSGSSGSAADLPDPVPTTATAQQALMANDKAYAAQCLAHSGSLLDFVGTVDTARDLDRIREALGDTTLTFFGHSYGTLLGATYAEMFPTHVRAMVLDGAIDPAMSTEEMVFEQSQSFEAVLGDFFAWCASVRCAWQGGSDPTNALLALINRSRTAPLPAPGGRSAGPGEFYNAVLASLYSRSSWPALASALAQAAAGHGAALVSLSDSYLTHGSTNAAAAEVSIDCLDHPITRDLTTFTAFAFEAAVKAPVFGPLLAWGEMGCATWSAPPTRTPAPASDPGAPPVLVVGTTGDPATPYVWAQRLAAELHNGALLTWQGVSHVAYYYSACVRSAVEAYIVSGALPPPGTQCRD
jgi:pimeloyl-ACP methyl ester carboxylesterase